MFWRTLLALLLISSLAGAQEVVDIPPGTDKIQPLKLKEPAPYPGMLFDYDTALRWGNWLKQYKLHLKLDVEAEQKKCGVRLEAKDQILQLNVDTHKQIEKDYRVQILKLEKRNIELDEELRNPPFWRTAWFGVAIGVVGSVGVGVTAVVLTNRL